MELRFYYAAKGGDVEEATEILRGNPDLNVDWGNVEEHNQTALQIACENGHGPVVSLLLVHPDIDVNLQDIFGRTVFFTSCVKGRRSYICQLLEDPRVKVKPIYDGDTALMCAAYWGHLEVIKMWIASGREMDLGQAGDYHADAIGEAKKTGKLEVVALLQRLKGNPLETRHKVRLEIGYYNEVAAEMFSLVVFVSDGLLQINDITPAARFFSIAAQLPLELQMMLCYRVAGSAREIIQGRDIEVAFKEMAKRI